jgi:hypothetical protein
MIRWAIERSTAIKKQLAVGSWQLANILNSKGPSNMTGLLNFYFLILTY